MKVAVDTNILVYAEGYLDTEHGEVAKRMLQMLAGRLIIPVQTLSELYNVLIRKARRERTVVQRALGNWSAAGIVAHADALVFEDAVQLAVDHDFQIWDAVVVATALAAGAKLLLSEDMQHGFSWKSLTIVNPFIEPRHRLLQAALAFSR